MSFGVVMGMRTVKLFEIDLHTSTPTKNYLENKILPIFSCPCYPPSVTLERGIGEM